ncbi:unnamed protein product [Ostreobium quekettii]|uniref:Uncharacterized protein n=1 Tax=Ostreobium quekettii TaxID=121088 RepID=A0A8S1IRH5_9CHLO|nr:unnamed protein product [Ostreobium quekettii]
MMSRREDRSSGHQACEGWSRLFPHVLDGVEALMAKHEAVVLRRRARLVNRHWCQWATQAVKSLKVIDESTTEGRMDNIAQRFSALEGLTLTDPDKCDLAPPLCFFSSLCLLRQLRNLTIGVRALSGGDMTFLACVTNLVSLELFKCFALTDQDLLEVTALVGLTRLHLRDCWQVSGNGLARLAGLPLLADLDVSGSCITEVGLGHLAAMASLTKVVLPQWIAFGRWLPAKMARFWAEMTNLVMLDMSHCRITGCATSDLLPLLQPLTSLTELHPLETISDDGLQALGSLTNLSRIGLHYCTQVTSNGFNFLKQFPKLVQLEVRQLKSISCSTTSIIGGLTNLMDLTLFAFPDMGIDGISALSGLTALTALRLETRGSTVAESMACLSNLTSLKKLILVGTCASSDDTSAWMALRSLTKLKFRAANITDMSMAGLGGLTGLVKLELHHCEDVTDLGMQALGLLSALSVLRLEGCSRITEAGLRHLLALRFLRRVEIVGCPDLASRVEDVLKQWN